MVKSVLSVNFQGLRDWIIQRVTAVIMAVYSVGFVYYIATNPELDYTSWHTLFSMTWMKVATILMVFSVLFHGWVGIWTVLTDYVKPFVLRCILSSLFLLMLVACGIWALLILWSV